MKIGLLVDDTLDKPDGVQQYVLGLGSWLSQQGHEVHYLAGESKRTDVPNIHSLSRTVAVRFNGNSLGTPLPASNKRIKQLLAQLQLDIIHVQTPHSPFMAQKVIMAAGQTPVVSTFHILPDSASLIWGMRLLRPFLRPSLDRIGTMFAVSEGARAFVDQMWHIKVGVLPNHIDLKKFNNATALPQYADTLTIVYLNRLVPRKGALHLVKAIGYIRDNQLFGQPYRLIICGKGPEKASLEAYIRQHQLDDLITLQGFVSEEAKPHYLASSDIAVYPSTGGESFGIVLLEGMATSKGVVLGGNNPGYACVLQPHPEQLVEPANTEAFANKLVHYLSDQQARQAAHDWQVQDVGQYDINVVGAKLLAAYQRLIDTKS